MSEYYQTCPQPKGPSRKTLKGRKVRVHRGNVTEVRAYCFGRERNICRICRFRPAESMDEVTPRSLGGKISRTNSHAVCGSGTTGCHGFKGGHQIRCEKLTPHGTEGAMAFTPLTRQAADWMRVKVGQRIESLPMQQMEEAI